LKWFTVSLTNCLSSGSATSSGTVSQRTELTGGHRQILSALKLPELPRFYEFTPAPE
jgi:hypothetical protein